MNPETNEPDPEELERRKQWFEWHVDKMENDSVVKPLQDGEDYRCPCCGYKTLAERGRYEICSVCYWEDDGQDEHDAAVVRGGPNGALSLEQARANYQEFGACEREFMQRVRKPRPEEL